MHHRLRNKPPGVSVSQPNEVRCECSLGTPHRRRTLLQRRCGWKDILRFTRSAHHSIADSRKWQLERSKHGSCLATSPRETWTAAAANLTSLCHLAVRNDDIVDGLGLLLDVFAARPVKCERHWCRLQCPPFKSEQYQ